MIPTGVLLLLLLLPLLLLLQLLLTSLSHRWPPVGSDSLLWPLSVVATLSASRDHVELREIVSDRARWREIIKTPISCEKRIAEAQARAEGQEAVANQLRGPAGTE